MAVRVGAALFGVALGTIAPSASAFCRSTTCSGPECARDDDGCKTSGAKLTWPGACVGFSIQRDGTVNLPMPQVEKAIEASFLAWTDVPCDAGGVATISFSRQENVACKR